MNDKSEFRGIVALVTGASACIRNISYRLGRVPDFDSASETFAHDAEANRMLTREYRSPYAVPAPV